VTSLPPDLISAALPGLLSVGAAVLLLAILPGVVVAHSLFARPRPLDVLVLGPPLGFAAVALLSYAWNLVPFDDHFTPPAALPVVLGWATLMILCRAGIGSIRARGLWLDRPPGEGEAAEAIGIASLSVLVFGAYFLAYDRDLFAFTGMHRLVAVAARVPVGEFWTLAGRTPSLATDPGAAPHGVVALLSVLPTVLGFLGVRVAFAGLHAGLAAAVHVGARRAGASGGGALAAFSVAALHPAFLDTPTASAAHVALAASAVAFAVLLSQRQPGAGTAASVGAPGPAPGWTAALGTGAVAALAVGSHHALLLSLPALGVLAWRGVAPVRRARFTAVAALGVGLGLVPFLVHHSLAFGSPLAIEAAPGAVPTTHAVAGLTFEYGGLLNRPFHDTFVRTPHNLLPSFLQSGLWIGRTTGTLLLGVAALGLARLPAGVRASAALWIVPGVLLLAPQEAWFEPDKQQLYTVWAAPALLAIAVGVDELRGPRGKAGWGVVGLLMVLGTVAGRGLVEVDAQVDDRFNERWPHLREELDGETDATPTRTAWVWPWPQWESEGRPLEGRLRAAAEDLARPDWAQRGAGPREHMLWETTPTAYGLFHVPRSLEPRPVNWLPPKGPADRVVVDLAVPWPGEAGPAVRAAWPEERNVSGFERPRTYDLRLPWLPYPPALYMFRSARAPWDSYVVVSGPASDVLPRLAESAPEVVAAATAPEAPEVDALFHSLKGTELVVPLPAGSRLHLVEIVSAVPWRAQEWIVPAPDPGEAPEVSGPHLVPP